MAPSGDGAESPSSGASGVRSNTVVATPTFDPNGSVKPTNDQTIQQIKAYLDAHHISYLASASKSDLLALAK